MAVRTERLFILRDLFSSILITESEFQQTEIQTIYVIRSMFILVDITSSTLEHLCFSMLQTLFGNNCQTLLLQILLLLHFASLWARVWETKYTLPPGTGPNVGGKFQQGFPFPWQITASDLVVLCQIVHPQCFLTSLMWQEGRHVCKKSCTSNPQRFLDLQQRRRFCCCYCPFIGICVCTLTPKYIL